MTANEKVYQEGQGEIYCTGEWRADDFVYKEQRACRVAVALPSKPKSSKNNLGFKLVIAMSDQIICLSDTDDELSSSKDRDIVVNDVDHEKLHKSDSGVDFDFPPVNFHYSINKSTNVFESSKATKQISDNLNVFESAVIDSQNYEFDYDNIENEVRSRRASPEKRDSATVPGRTNETNKRKKAPRTKNTLEQETERVRTKENAAIEKRLKELERRNRKNIQPGECLKFITVNLDKDLEHDACSSEIIDVLRNYEISCNFDSQPIPNSVTWTRKVENYRVNDQNQICEESVEQKENQIVIIWNWEETVQKIKDKTFVPSVTSMASIFPKERLSLIIYGMENYFERCTKSKKQKSDKNDARQMKISRDDLEFGLAEIQLTLGCNSTLVESPQELAMLVYRYTKSIAEIPLKMERRQKIVDKMDWYAMGDNRDTVKVDKNGNGLKRLWQQQLCQFNLAGLETAEAICSVYSSPWDLMHAYETCSQSEGEKLLKDIPIRRAAGPLSTARKIGPELSKKIFIMFTSKNGEESLDNDRVT